MRSASWMALIFVTWAPVVRAGPLTDTPPPGKHFPLTPSAHEESPTFKSGVPVIGTTYFYWYDVYSGTHLIDPDGTDALTTHPPFDALADLSYQSSSWHYTQLQDVVRAGIDFILPVYWGVPGQYEHGPFAWSFAGLPPLVAAHDRMLREHAVDFTRPLPPQIGLFYDTSTLASNDFDGPGQHVHVDLTTPEGREWFYVTIRDFFSLIPPEKWARIDGRPIVFLYTAAFAHDIDEELFEDTRWRFQADFGTDLFIVRHSDWPGQADAWYQWGGALGLTLGDAVAGVGPGYDDSGVAGRQPLVVDRQRGKFYDRQWEKLLHMNRRRRPWMVHVETWNEWHEGTDVARSAVWGDQYIRATAKYARLFHTGARLEPTGKFVNAERVRWSLSGVAGLTLLPSAGDGCWELVDVAGSPSIVSTRCAGQPNNYLYFDVDDSYLYDESRRVVELTIVFLDDGGCDAFGIHYDNADPAAGSLDGAFRSGPTVSVGHTGAWCTAILRLPDARCINRANKADFRLAPAGGDGRLTIREVLLRSLPGQLVR